MEYQILQKSEIKFVGVAVRTTNENMQAMKDIPALWERFYKENIKEKIPNKVGEDVMCLYTDYEKDHTKPYACIIGCEVSSFENIPENLVSKIIPESTYAVFDLKGEFPKTLFDTWQYVWSSNLQRTYGGDFEVYDINFQNKKSTDLKVCVAVE